MNNLETMAQMKRGILQDIEKAQRNLKLRGAAMAVIEASLLIAYLAVMDFHDRLHWLVLIAALLTYGTITAGLVTMAAKLDLNSQRILKAIVMADDHKE